MLSTEDNSFILQWPLNTNKWQFSSYVLSLADWQNAEQKNI